MLRARRPPSEFAEAPFKTGTGQEIQADISLNLLLL